MPNFISAVMAVAADEGTTISFSQAKKIARRIEKREDAQQVIDPYAYVLDFWDETGELATDNVMAENAARRINERNAA